MLLLLTLCLLLPMFTGAGLPVTGVMLRISAEPLATLDASFVSVTVDYMPGAGVFDLDLGDAKLIQLAQGLAPGLLRLGGSAEDATVFATSEADCARQLAQGRPGSAEGYACKGQPTRCLLASRWEAWLRFANKTGLRPVLGLDGCFGRAGRSSSLNLSNAASLLSFTARLPAALTSTMAFELGNEMSECTAGTARWTPYNCSAYSPTRGVGAATWQADAAALAEQIAQLWPAEAGSTRPELFGPDCAGLDTLYAQSAAAAKGLSALTYHQYPECVPPAWGCSLANSSHGCTSYGCRWNASSQACRWVGEAAAGNGTAEEAEEDLELVLPPDCLAQVPRLARNLVPIARAARVKLIAGETAEHAYGGKETPLFAVPFIYKMHHFTKTGSGQT
jgi:hypothetical protein